MPEPFFLPSWPPEIGAFVWYGVLLLAAELMGEAVFRWLHQPRIIGWVLVGFILGPHVTGAVDEETLISLGDFLNIAIGIVLFELGQRASLTWLRRNPWLLGTSIAESALSFAAVFLVLQMLGRPPLVSSVAAAIAMCTSPAVILALSRDLRAQGQVTERALLFTTLNTIFTLLSTALLYAWLASEYTGDWINILGHPVYLVLGSIVLAAIFTSATLAMLRLVGPRDEPQFICVMAMVIAAVWASSALNLSVGLTLVSYGTMMRTFDAQRQFVSLRFGRIGRIVFILLFTITAARLDVSFLPEAALAGLAIVVSRFLGKWAGIFALAERSGLARGKSFHLALAMTPQASLAIILVHQTSMMYPEFGPALVTVMMTGILILEFVGPVLTQFAIKRSKEAFEEGVMT